MLGKLNNKYFALALVVLLALPSVWYLFVPGFIKTDDGNWMIIRFSAFYQALRDGQFPVRFLGRLNFGYGYPVSNFLYPGFMYLGIPFKILGLSFVNVVKIIIAGSVVLSGAFVYLWLTKLFDIWESLFAGLFYVYSAYHIFDVTKRGSVGEILALAVAPLLFWQVEEGNIIISSLALSLLIISHNTLAILFLGLLLSYMILSVIVAKKKDDLINVYKQIIFFGLGISAFFSVPAVLELGNTVFLQTKISNFSNYFADYDLIGIATIFLIVAGVIAFIIEKDLYKKHRMTLLMLSISAISIYFATPYSSFLWRLLPVGFIQFPFRVLSVTILSASFLAAFFLSRIPIKFRFAAGIILIVVTATLSVKYLLPSFDKLPDSFYSTNEDSTTVANEYMPKWVQVKPVAHPPAKVAVVAGEGNISNVIYNNQKISFNFSSQSPSIVRVNTIYYPGWTAYSNDVQKAIFHDNKFGVMDIKLIPGNEKISFYFGETPLRIMADLISLLSFFGLFIWVYQKKIFNLLVKIINKK